KIVTVDATAEAPNRTDAELSGVIESTQIKEIPVSGRNWASLMLLTPGAINYGNGTQRAIRFSGHSLDDSNFTFDGVDASGVQEQTQKSDTRLNIALDAIQEFRVSTSNYTAESGAAGGAQINVVSKAGTNQFHGGTFYALRSDKLDSRSPFDGPTLPPFSLHQFGAGLGGPIVKDKAFFYLNYEGLRQSHVITSRQTISRTWLILWLPFLIPRISSTVRRQSPAIARTFTMKTGTESSSSSYRMNGFLKPAPRQRRHVTSSIVTH